MKALITGASSGIGREYAKILHKKGYDVIIVARRIERLYELKDELGGENITVYQCDLSDKGECYRLFEQFNDTDILINNAGFGVFGDFLDTPLEEELNMIDLNIKAVHILTKLYLKEMTKRNSGYILNVASSAAFFPGPMFSSYYASKAYIYRLTLALSEEMKKNNTNVHLSVFCPGPVSTEFNSVAGVRFSIPPIDAQYAANYSLLKMFDKKTVIIPALNIKLSRIASKIVPDKICAKIVYRIQKSKKS